MATASRSNYVIIDSQIAGLAFESKLPEKRVVTEQSLVLKFRLMTYNIGGGRKAFASNLEAILKVIAGASPDILVVQEATDYQDADGLWFSAADQIAQVGGFGNNYYFGPTLTMRDHMHVERPIMVAGLFSDWQDWRHGNAVFCRWGFVRLGDSSSVGHPRNVPIYRPPVYEGNRDTDPRYAILARINYPPFFPLVIATHLTTLLGERGGQGREISGKTEDARVFRYRQARRIIDLIKGHTANEIIFLMGDLNAVASEPAIASVLEKEGGFSRLIPNNPQPTHPKATDAIEHIFVYPEERVISYSCEIVDNEIAKRASDHLPVLAEIRMR